MSSPIQLSSGTQRTVTMVVVICRRDSRSIASPSSENSMRKELAKRRNSDDLRPEYDLARLKGGVRGKYYQRATAGTNLVLLEPDVARVFPDSNSVNRALRLLHEVATKSSARSRKLAGGRRRATG